MPRIAARSLNKRYASPYGNIRTRPVSKRNGDKRRDIDVAKGGVSAKSKLVRNPVNNASTVNASGLERIVRLGPTWDGRGEKALRVDGSAYPVSHGGVYSLCTISCKTIGFRRGEPSLS